MRAASALKVCASKEGSSDYRYFPEPDLPPIVVSVEQKEAWQADLPELPAQKRTRYERIWPFGLRCSSFADERPLPNILRPRFATGADPKAHRQLDYSRHCRLPQYRKTHDRGRWR
jgi:aspartyl-tRNA(Asn)/glutamyl-tRNA(Gln) amidotransferase subunit B